MTQRKKKIARWVLQGICVLVMFVGFSCVLLLITTALSMPRDDLALLCFWVLYSGIMLVVGAWLTRDSYLMFRGRAFGAIRSLPAVLAFSVIGLVVKPLDSFAAPLVSGIQARTLVSLACFLVALLAAVLVYSLGTKLLQRLADAAYGPPDISGTQPSPDKQ
jgi:hypothetical protein